MQTHFRLIKLNLCVPKIVFVLCRLSSHLLALLSSFPRMLSLSRARGKLPSFVAAFWREPHILELRRESPMKTKTACV